MTGIRASKKEKDLIRLLYRTCGSGLSLELMFVRMECKMNNLEGTLQNEKLLKENLRVELTLEQARKEQEMERVKEIEVELRAVQEQLRALQSSSHASGVGVLSETPLHKTYRKEQVCLVEFLHWYLVFLRKLGNG